ncbi:hypothetical protein PAXRUDRAFT_34354 [Paxillus rubicundulus Ve08.2h10]|uniref:Unplaced genomic scaffold scaffold_420, whole genome shotgun sequence n=1 Tax=Paxillus rubicundulus Ve08.2h10 TaxID=930991 RepID=A0A0D0E5K5_9AGAM|nr:hypothetical protein PAXRUDRAFT_34354 [Paxillus rubicundulus Ve08.2h10]
MALHLFFTKWLPGAEVPDQQRMSSQLLDNHGAQVEERIREHVLGEYAIGQCDGWKNVSKKALVTSIMSVDFKPYLIHTHNISEEQKNAENLLVHILADIQTMEEHFNVTVIAWCSDAAGDACKMQNDLIKAWPWMILIDYWAHQGNLIVGDIFKVKVTLLATIDQAADVIKWFNNYSRALGILHHEQMVTYQQTLVLILPLLETSGALCSCCIKRNEELISCVENKWPDHEKAKVIMAIVVDVDFWENMTILKQVFGCNSDLAFHLAFFDYISSLCEYSPELMQLCHFRELCNRNGESVNIVQIWKYMDTRVEGGQNDLAKLAICILSIVPNSARCEQNFSHFDIIHTKLCNHISEQKVHKLSLVKQDIHCLHMEVGLIRPRKRHKFLQYHHAENCPSTSTPSDEQAADSDSSEDESPTGTAHTHIPLKNLFDYSRHIDAFESVWVGGAKSLSEELSFYDISFSAESNHNIPDTSMSMSTVASEHL